MAVSGVTLAFPKTVQEPGVSSGQVGPLITLFMLQGIFLALAAVRWGRGPGENSAASNKMVRSKTQWRQLSTTCCG